jgi:protein-tyrosine phosphatase
VTGARRPREILRGRCRGENVGRRRFAGAVRIERRLKPGRRIDIPSVPNLRDLGGYPTEEGGQVRTGQLYRSVELDHLEGQDEDLESFVRLGVRTVFDLRTAAEREAAPDVVLDGTEQVVCDVLKDSQNLAPAVLGKVLSDPSFARQLLGDGKAVELFETAYREIVTLPSALSAYRAFFNAIIEDGRRPALFHLHDLQGPNGVGGGGDLDGARSPRAARLL